MAPSTLLKFQIWVGRLTAPATQVLCSAGGTLPGGYTPKHEATALKETGQFQASQVKLPMTGAALDLRGIRRGQEFPYPGFPFGAARTKGESAECTEPHLSHS